MNKLLIILTLSTIVLSLTACQTMKGLGEDVEKAGRWVQEKAS